MMLAILVFGGGLAYWLGLIVNQRVLLIAGTGLLIAALGVMIHEGSVEWFAIPFPGFAALLAFALKRGDPGFWQLVGWTVFIAVALAPGFRATPFFSPVETVQTVEHLYRFPPGIGWFPGLLGSGRRLPGNGWQRRQSNVPHTRDSRTCCRRDLLLRRP